MVDVQQEFERDTMTTFAGEDIERARLLIGKGLASRRVEHITTASDDSIRNHALGGAWRKRAITRLGRSIECAQCCRTGVCSTHHSEGGPR